MKPFFICKSGIIRLFKDAFFYACTEYREIRIFKHAVIVQKNLSPGNKRLPVHDRYTTITIRF
jgi:hypothetical protein